MTTTGIAPKAEQPEVKGVGQVPAPETRVAGAEKHTDETPRTYSQEELDARMGKAGGRMKAQLELVTKERDDFRAKHESATKAHGELNSQITQAKEQIDTLNNTLDSLDSEDAGKVRQTIREWEKRLNSLNEREKNLVPREERVNSFERVELIYAVADEYGLDEPDAKDKFKAAADRLGIKEREGLMTLAETMNLKLRDEEEEPEETPKPKAPKPYSGKSSGGSPESLEALKSVDTRFMGLKALSEHKAKLIEAQKRQR